MRFPLYSIKIGLAVFLPVLAALVLGLFAVFRLDVLASRARSLETGRLPRADLAASVERRLLLAAHAIRGYALSGDREALDQAKQELAGAADALHAAREAASRPGLAGLAAEADRIAGFLDAYKKAAEGAVASNDRVAEARAALTRAAEAYAAAGAAFADWKTAQWDKELAAKYPNPDNLRQYAKKLKSAAAALAAGRDVREAAETARASREPAILAKAVSRFDDAEAALREARGTDEDAKRLAPVFAALTEYRQAVSTLLSQWEELRATGRRILEAERAALGAATSLGGTSLKEAAGDANAVAASLDSSRFWITVLTWGILILGLAFAVVAAVALGEPVRRCAAFARDMVVGRWTETLTVSGHDEVGKLAENLREMARRMGKRLAR